MKLLEGWRKLNPIEVSICHFDDNQIKSKRICTVKWDSNETPLIIAKELGHEHYHHYFKNGKLTAHIRNNKTREKLDSKTGISNSISEVLSKFYRNELK